MEGKGRGEEGRRGEGRGEWGGQEGRGVEGVGTGCLREVEEREYLCVGGGGGGGGRWKGEKGKW